MFGTVANGVLRGHKYICIPLNSKSAFWGLLEIYGSKLEVLRTKTKFVSKLFISSLFTSYNQYPKIRTISICNCAMKISLHCSIK